MRLWREQGIVWAALLALSNSSLAASISLTPLDNDPAHARVAVEGPFEAGDEIKFRTEVGRLTKAVVVFNSDGGILQAGIEIGKTIRLKSFATAVLDGSRCASSCAFAWLGGSPRFMQRGAQIGFHAAYINREGRPSESGVGNALVGSYLTQIGLPETAVIYVTKAAPTQLTFLTLQDAQRIGIEVLPFEQYAPTTEPAQRITPRGHQELTLECGAAKSTPPDNDPDPIYRTKIAVTDQVIYVEHYAASGKTFSRNEQYRDQRFWPQEKTNNWSGVSVKRPDRTMVGSIRMDKGGQRVEYTEKVYRSGKLEVTIVSVCRRIPGPNKTEPLPPDPPVTFEQHAPTTKPAHDPPPLKWDDVRIIPRETPRDDQELIKRALSFVNEIHSKWSETNAAGLAWLDPLYADEVDFYGNSISRGQVLTEKRLFTERWPERNYRIQPNSMNAVCGSHAITMECIVTGTVEWRTRSPARNATASGLAGFTYVLGASGETFFIKGEHGSALQGPSENFGPEWRLKSEAVTFVTNFFNLWSVLSGAELMSALAKSYAENVDYDGVKKTAVDVLADKQKWLQRWPIQNYRVRLESMNTNCSESTLECMTTGIVDWIAKSPERSTAVGSSSFSFSLGKPSPERFVIMRENFVVLTNQNSGR